MVEVKVKAIVIDSITGSPIVLLYDINNPNDIYHIWIGVAEAEGIVIAQSGFNPPRPLTYDLFKNVIEALDSEVKEVRIVDFVNNAYIANIIINKEGKEIAIDSRPSDAINLALRFNAPIFLNENVVKKVNLEDIKISETENNINTIEDLGKQVEAVEDSTIKDEDLEKFRKMLENIKPEDFMIK